MNPDLSYANLASLCAQGAVCAKRSESYEDIHFWSTYALNMAQLASAEKERTEGEAFRVEKLAELAIA